MTDTPAGIVAALAAFQADLPRIEKTQRANVGQYGYSYADLAEVSAVVLPKLAAHGIAYTAPLVRDGDNYVLEAKLLHTGGETIGCEWPIPRAKPQDMGSAVTYGRRYCLLALTGVHPVGEDDDGASAQEREARKPPELTKPVTRVRAKKGQPKPADVLDEWSTPVPVDNGAGGNTTGAQLAAIWARLTTLEVPRDMWKTEIGTILGRTVESSADLSRHEVGTLLDVLGARVLVAQNAPAQPALLPTNDDPVCNVADPETGVLCQLADGHPGRHAW